MTPPPARRAPRRVALLLLATGVGVPGRHAGPVVGGVPGGAVLCGALAGGLCALLAA